MVYIFVSLGIPHKWRPTAGSLIDRTAKRELPNSVRNFYRNRSYSFVAKNKYHWIEYTIFTINILRTSKGLALNRPVIDQILPQKFSSPKIVASVG